MSLHLSSVYPVLVLFSIIVTLLFALAYLCRFIDPRLLWWIHPFAPLLPVLACCLVVVLCFAWYWENGALILINLGVLGLYVWRLLPSQHRRAENTEPYPTLRILTVNAKPLTNDQDQRVAERMDLDRPDVVAVQEAAIYADLARQRLAVPRYLYPLFQQGASLRTRGMEGYQRITHPIFSHFQWVSLDPIASPRGGGKLLGTRAVFAWEQGHIAIYNVHMHSFLTASSMSPPPRFSPRWWRTIKADYEIRAAEAVLLRQRLDEEPLPFIVCGDLNSTPHAWVYSHLVHRLLIDTFRTRGKGWGGTYHATSPIFRIDYILASQHWHVLDCRVAARMGSDHRPILATLALTTSVHV